MSSKLILLLSFLLIASSYAQAPDPNTEGAESDRPTQQTEETSSNDEKSINQVQMNPSQTSREDIVLIYSEEKKHFIDSNNKKANLLELISEKKKSVTVLLESENYEKIGIKFKFKEVRGNRDELKVVMSSYDEDFSKKYASIVFVLNVKDTLDEVNASFLDSFDELLENDPRGEFFHFSDGQMIGLMVFASIGAAVVLKYTIVPMAIIGGVAGLSYLVYVTIKELYFNEENEEEEKTLHDLLKNAPPKA